MFSQKSGLMEEIRSKFAQVDNCPFEGPRVFFENAGGALTLNTVVDTSARFAAIPDNQGRANGASQALVDIIDKAKSDAMVLLGADTGQVFVGESGTELIFRTVSNAILATEEGGNVVGTTLEHPATRSAAQRWAKQAEKQYLPVPHNNDTGTVSAEDYALVVTPETRVVTIIHTSPVTGMGVDVGSIAKTVRGISPDCFIVVDGIQHAAHGSFDIKSYDIDAYVISPYKAFSRHGYGLAWISDRLSGVEHDMLIGGPDLKWELGTRDTGAYATFSDVVAYLEWLGEHFTDSADRREKLVAAGKAIHAHEQELTDAIINGTGNLPGLRDMEKVSIIGGWDNPAREGLVAINVDGLEAAEVVDRLNAAGIRTHTRKDDFYSANVLTPLGLNSCVRVSLCHYNSLHEVSQFLAALKEIAD